MTEVTFKTNEHEYELTIKGHSGSAKKGEDLVCAGASTLCLTMAQILEENAKALAETPTIDIKDGDAVIKWKPTPEAEGALRNCIYAVMTGFRVLEYNNPEHLAVK